MPEVTKRINILYLNGVEYFYFYFLFFAFRTNGWYEVVSFPVGSFLLFFGKFDVKKGCYKYASIVENRAGVPARIFSYFLWWKDQVGTAGETWNLSDTR